MKRIVFVIIVSIVLALTGCFLWEETPNTVALSSISSYEVYEFNAIGLKAVAIRKDALPKPMQGTELSLTVEGIAYSLEANPLVPGILQAILLDRHSAQAIRESHIVLSKGGRGLSERAGITIASVIIRKAPGENGTELYRIGTEDYISLRMANRFVFTAGGSFIAPEDVVSSEGKVYPTEIFLQARMATGSIDGAFAWLKGHPELEATGLVYNRVRLVQGQIVIDPPGSFFILNLESSPIFGGTLSGAGCYNAGETAYVLASPKSGYRFTKWMKGEEEISSVPGLYYKMPAEDTTITAYFELRDPILQLTFDNTLLDSSGHGHHGRLLQGTEEFMPGVVNSSAQFNGLPQIVVDNHAELNTNEVMTLMFWYRQDDQGGRFHSSPIMKWNCSTIGGQWWVGIDTGRANERKEYITFFHKIGTYHRIGQSKEYVINPNNEEWVHLAFTFNKGNAKKYRNGVLEEASMASFPELFSANYPINHINIGYMPWSATQGAYNFNGRLDEVKLFNLELSKEAIYQIYTVEKQSVSRE